MPTYDSAARIIEDFLDSNWTFSKVAFENVAAIDYSDADRKALSQGEDPFIAVKIIYGPSAAAETGQNAIKRTWGNLAVDFYTKENKGTSINQTNIDNLSNLFEYKTISDIVFRDITVMRSVPMEGWFITPILVRFYFNR
ncbi:MAG: hypothetical protein PVI43_00080 [Candidatus Bathyarchaeota archaeon]|jgi:hypothetical protein